MKVLSIDFDYFQNVTREQLSLYPDGIDLPPEISDIVWSSHYFANEKELRKITINFRLYSEMIRILTHQEKKTPVMIANSHVRAYDFILGNLRKSNHEYIDLVNVDLHHDYYNDNQKLDCGNWIKHLEGAAKLIGLRWICREVSLDAYGFSDSDKVKLMPLCLGLDSLRNEFFDAIFICRSDPWLPPHLDDYFDNLYRICISQFDNVLAEQRITQPRYLPEITLKK